ncbi:MAG: DUF4870 domain-containing protein [Chloroflexi bacterium]|nr:DUF4870 domain-containing protein [Chloroflexota bacterium]
METKGTSEEVKASRQAFRKLEITSDERTWAILAHVSILLAAITVGLLGPVAAFVIWLIKKDESDYVAKQALQSLIYQIVVAVLSWIMWIAIAVLFAVVIGFCLIPLGILVNLAAIGYGCYAAYVCSLGQEFRYPIIWEMITTE